MKIRPKVITIAGLDPSGGAGILADIKTFETLKCYGLAVCTANTTQSDITFENCHWVDVEVIKDQIQILFERFEINFVKIGIVQNWSILNQIIDFLLLKNKAIKIILDPILKSSSAFEFHNSNTWNIGINSDFDDVLDKIHLITPNYHEVEKLFFDKSIQDTIDYIRSKTNLLLKGGHNKNAIGKDELYSKGGEKYILNPKGHNISQKHGSGCVLSSAILSYQALGFSLLKSCYRGKRYTEKFLSSNNSLLGYHK